MNQDLLGEAVQCGSCGAQMRLDAGHRTTRCPFCDVPAVVERPPTPDRPSPVFVLGFLVEQPAAAAAVRRWIRARRMGPFGLRHQALDRLTGLYLPAYLYSATAVSQYAASIAEKYQTVGWGNDSDERSGLRRREETEYRDLTGRHVQGVTDLLVSASRNLPNAALEAIEPFDLGRLRRYTPGLISGWVAEEPSREAQECLESGRGEVRALAGQWLRAFMPGDGVRALQHQTAVEDESMDLTLVPVWVCTVRYHPRKPPLRILVNGQTGKVGGAWPVSWAKLGIALGFVLGLAWIALLVLGRWL